MLQSITNRGHSSLRLEWKYLPSRYVTGFVALQSLFPSTHGKCRKSGKFLKGILDNKVAENSDLFKVSRVHLS